MAGSPRSYIETGSFLQLCLRFSFGVPFAESVTEVSQWHWTQVATGAWWFSKAAMSKLCMGMLTNCGSYKMTMIISAAQACFLFLRALVYQLLAWFLTRHKWAWAGQAPRAVEQAPGAVRPHKFSKRSGNRGKLSRTLIVSTLLKKTIVMSFGTIRLRQTPKLEWQTGGRCRRRADLHYFWRTMTYLERSFTKWSATPRQSCIVLATSFCCELNVR